MIQPGMTGMMFGGDGPIMQGTWYNPSTGDAFTVRDSFFEDNQYVVTTTDGRYLKYDQLQRYVQTDMKLEDLKKIKNEKSKQETNDVLPAEISSILETEGESNNYDILPEDMELISGKKNNLGNLFTSHANPTLTTLTMNPTNNNIMDPKPQVNVNMNTAIIEKALKNSSNPKFSLKVDWKDYPTRQIGMLMDIMEIPVEDIVEWYLNNISMDEFVLTFKNSIKEKIIGKSNTKTEETLQVDESNITDELPKTAKVAKVSQKSKTSTNKTSEKSQAKNKSK